MFFNNQPSNDIKLYNILGVSKSANETDIKKAYKKLALMYHPDRNKSDDAESKFKEIAGAYDILGDKEKRDQYDKYGLEAVKQGQGSPGFNMGDPFDIFDNIFPGGGNPFSAHTRRPPQRQGKSMMKEVEIELEDIYNEVSLNITMSHLVKCKHCDGIGCKDPNDIINCSNCDGTGMIVKIQQFGPGMISQSTQVCSSCVGKGKNVDPSKLCGECDGKKRQKKKRKITLHLKKTHTTGDKIVYNGIADYNPTVDIQGDLILLIKEINTKTTLTRINNDLFIEKTISLIDALCGMELTIKQLDGRNLFIKTSEVIQPNSIYKINGEGMTRKHDLYIKFNVVFPPRLSDERKQYIKKVIQQNSEIHPQDDTISKEYKFIESVSKSEHENINNKINLLNIKQTKTKYNPSYDNDQDQGQGHGQDQDQDQGHENMVDGNPINCATQ
jgi:DnaJ homolog subfamily A member 2